VVEAEDVWIVAAVPRVFEIADDDPEAGDDPAEVAEDARAVTVLPADTSGAVGCIDAGEGAA
jgi:hypothetical protein